LPGQAESYNPVATIAKDIEIESGAVQKEVEKVIHEIEKPIEDKKVEDSTKGPETMEEKVE